jgi:hypothetical protein
MMALTWVKKIYIQRELQVIQFHFKIFFKMPFQKYSNKSSYFRNSSRYLNLLQDQLTSGLSKVYYFLIID